MYKIYVKCLFFIFYILYLYKNILTVKLGVYSDGEFQLIKFFMVE